MRRTIPGQLDLLRLDEDRIRAQPFAGLQRLAHELIVTNVADIRLKVGDKRCLRPVRPLHFEDAKPCFHARFDGWERRDRFKRPGMTLAPEAVHIRVHVLDGGVAIVPLGKERIKLLQSFQKIRMMVMRDTMLFAGAHFNWVYALFYIPAFAKDFHRHVVEYEIGERLLLDIWIGKHDPKGNALVVSLGKLNRNLPVLELIESTAPTLHLAPCRADIELARHRNLHDLLDCFPHGLIPFSLG